MSTNLIVGNVSKIVGTRFTIKSNLELKFEIAVNNGHRDNTGTWVPDPTRYHTVVVYGDLAENLASTFLDHEKDGIGMRLMVGYDVRDDSFKPKGKDYTVPKTTLVATAVGPELRFATAQVTKVDKTPADPAAPTDANPLVAV